MAEQSTDLMMIVDGDHVVRWANVAFERMLGYPPESVVGKDVSLLFQDDDIPAVVATMERLRNVPEGRGAVDVRMRAADGSWHLMATSGTTLFDDPAIRGFAVSMTDVTDQRQSEAALQAAEARYRDLVERARDAVYTADLDGRLISANAATEQLTGYSRAELLTMTFFDLIALEDRERTHEILARKLSGGPDEISELQLVTKDGRRRYVEVSGRFVSCQGRPPHLEGIARETTERHALEEKLRHQASHDELTGLPNRTLLHDRLNQALARGKRDRSAVAVLLLDIDDFKLVNDSLGHEPGDELLVELARRLQSILRGDETVARLGGDEFALVAEGIRSTDAVVALAERVQTVFGEPFTVGGTLQQRTGSLGIAISKDDQAAPSDLLRDADIAMYRVKATRKGGFEFFDTAARKELMRSGARQGS